jgi:hypothetical protein
MEIAYCILYMTSFSTTQNCVHLLQMYRSVLRLKLVDVLGFFISTDRFCWPFAENPRQEDLRRDFTQGDSTLIHLAAHVLGRPIVIIPVCAEEAEMSSY